MKLKPNRYPKKTINIRFEFNDTEMRDVKILAYKCKMSLNDCIIYLLKVGLRKNKVFSELNNDEKKMFAFTTREERAYRRFCKGFDLNG